LIQIKAIIRPANQAAANGRACGAQAWGGGRSVLMSASVCAASVTDPVRVG